MTVVRPAAPSARTPRLERPLLQLVGRSVRFHTERGLANAVIDVSLEVAAGEILGLVGESGSGKTVTALSLIALLPPSAEVGGELRWEGVSLSPAEAVQMRGSRITLVNQEPMSSLDPLMPLGRQLVEVLRKHLRLNRGAAQRRALELFELVGIDDPPRRLRQFPWEFSGGMAQRAVIAMALAPQPQLLIADEPTTALDVTIQAQVLELIHRLRLEMSLSVMLVTHDLGVVAGLADRVAVMYAGRIVETASTRELFRSPKHPYTRGLLAASPQPGARLVRLDAIPGSPPSRAAGSGCAFAPRCAQASAVCANTPTLATTEPSGEHRVACWHV